MVLSCGTTPLPYTPDGQAVGQILGKIDVMLAQLDATSTHTVRLERIKRSLTELKSAKVGQAVAELSMKPTDERSGRRSLPSMMNCVP